MNYTPGPWSVDRPYIRGAERVIAALEPGRNEVEDAANARLIAAAPELYEALEELRDKVWRIIDLHRISEARAEANMALERANAALAKARGNEEDENA